MNTLEMMGWASYTQEFPVTETARLLVPARVIRENKRAYLVQTNEKICSAELTGKLVHDSDASDLPKVGDWVVGIQSSDDLFIIQERLERKNKISRKVSGNRSDEQVLAANIDLILIVVGLDNDFNMNRLERYLALAKQSEATPIIVLNKMDLCPELDTLKQDVLDHSQGHKILMISAKNSTGIDEISELFKPDKTGVLLGSSGVGKSTLTNGLIGRNEQVTKAVREDDNKGMHTTSFRQMFQLPDGGSLIDTPGMRELTLWEDASELGAVFEDLADIARSCKFRNCTHTVEKGCAIQAAVSDNLLDKKRLDNFMKMQKEVEFLQRKREDKAKRDYNYKQKKLHIKEKNNY